MSGNRAIENVSDTALWAAMCRAMETDRPDAHFSDPLARALAGERGAAILAGMPDGASTAWPVIVRTCVFDEMILEAVRERGAKVVVNLAAGLDARPYRLNLPSDLEWLEADLPGMIDYKAGRMGDAKPLCRLERVKLDLSDVRARREFFDRIDDEDRPTLVVTEGLLSSLTPEAAASLCDDLHVRMNIKWWLVDYAPPLLLKMLAKRGWTTAEERVLADEARRLKRETRFAWARRLLGLLMPAEKREALQRMSGFALLGRP